MFLTVYFRKVNLPLDKSLEFELRRKDHLPCLRTKLLSQFLFKVHEGQFRFNKTMSFRKKAYTYMFEFCSIETFGSA